MKPEIREVLPEIDIVRIVSYNGEKCEVIYASEFKRWLDKLTEGAQICEGIVDDSGLFQTSKALKKSVTSTHTALLICPREIKKQTPLEIAVEAIKEAISGYEQNYSTPDETAMSGIPVDPEHVLRKALAKIEAAK